MKFKKIFLIIVVILTLCGCVNIKDLSYDDIINNINELEKSPNTYKIGYQYYLPKGLSIINGGTNYAIIGSNDINYYLYVDLISYINKKELNYTIDNSIYYSKKISKDKLEGYIEIKIQENNQYLIEIMYNYAKIEVMVDEDSINKVLINAINILNSIKYNDTIINNLLNDDKLNYKEENFEMFENENNDSDILDYIEEDDEVVTPEEDIKDTDFIN